MGKNVANKNDKKSKDCAINAGKLLTGNKIPIKIDLEKSLTQIEADPALSLMN